MITKFGEVENTYISLYLEKVTNMIFAILPMYEEGCETIDSYIDSLTREMIGGSKIYFEVDLLKVAGTLKGLNFDSHKELKSDILKACNIVAKMKESVK